MGYYRRYLGTVELTPSVVSVADDRIAVCRGAGPPATGVTNLEATTAGAPLRTSKRWMLGFELGAGGGVHGGASACDVGVSDLGWSAGQAFDCDRRSSATALHIHVAKLRSRSFAWVGSIGSDRQSLTVKGADTDGSDDLAHVTFTAGVRAWLMPRLWVEADAGLAVAFRYWDWIPFSCHGGSGPDDTSTATCSTAANSIGVGVSGSVGFELLAFRSVALSARGRIATGIYGDLRVVIATAGFSADLFF